MRKNFSSCSIFLGYKSHFPENWGGGGGESHQETTGLLLRNYRIPVNPIRPGGGIRGPDDQTHSCQSETSYSMMPKLCDF